jgi:hypothetical protein
MPPPDFYKVAFNVDGGGDPSSWPRIYCPKGGLADLVADERLYRTIHYGAPVVITFEAEYEGRFLEQLVGTFVERCARRDRSAVLH